MKDLIDVVKRLKRTNSLGEKIEVLKGLDKSVRKKVEELFYYAYDNFIVFGVSGRFMDVYGSKLIVNWNEVKRVLEDLASGKLRGKIAEKNILELCKKMDKDGVELFNGILDKNLRCGVSRKILNRVMPGLISEFGVQLAEVFQDTLPKGVKEFIVEPKYDGLRLLSIFKNSNVFFLTRNGKEVDVPELRNVFMFDKIYSILDGWVLDGELVDERGFAMLMTYVRRKDYRRFKHDKKCVYYVFDIVPVEVFKKSVYKERLIDRKRRLERIWVELEKCKRFDGNLVRLVEYVVGTDKNMLEDYFKQCLKSRFEGVVIKNVDSWYELRRNDNWLKLKPVNTLDCKIIGIEEGTGKFKGMLGNLIVVQPNGVKCRVGSGISDELRKDIWTNKRKYIGKIVEVKYQELTPDGVMRFPRFVRMRWDKNKI